MNRKKAPERLTAFPGPFLCSSAEVQPGVDRRLRQDAAVADDGPARRAEADGVARVARVDDEQVGAAAGLEAVAGDLRCV